MRIINSLKYRYNNLPNNISISKLELIQHLSLLTCLADNSKNPLTNKFRKYFSQNDEDHIIIQILSRLNISEKNFIEIGSGNGLENNTLNLIALGWQGIWVDNKDLQVLLAKGMSVKYVQMWLDLDSINGLLPMFERSKPSVISIDLDGNDFFFVKEILQYGILPIIFICEYNGSLEPNVEFVQTYNKTHNWDGSNYYGASLKSYTDLFDSYNYSLVACNLTGANAFFIRNDHIDKFEDISRDTNELYATL
jgi:hypothetical protein